MRTIFNQSVLSGIMVGIGVVINASAGNKYVGAALFSVALLVIIACDLKLYTGKIGFVSTVSISQLSQLACMLVGNLVGVLVPVLLQAPWLSGVLMETAILKFEKNFFELFIRAMFCGILMYVAVISKNTITVIVCIMTFILSGYEHCIASFPFVILHFTGESLLKFVWIVLGNTVGSIFANFMNRKESECQTTSIPQSS